jgi:hypothetical protein
VLDTAIPKNVFQSGGFNHSDRINMLLPEPVVAALLIDISGDEVTTVDEDVVEADR